MASRLRVELAEDGWPHKNSGSVPVLFLSIYAESTILHFVITIMAFVVCDFDMLFFDSEIVKLPASCFQDQTRSIMSMSPHHPANDATGFFILSNALGWLR